MVVSQRDETQIITIVFVDKQDVNDLSTNELYKTINKLRDKMFSKYNTVGDIVDEKVAYVCQQNYGKRNDEKWGN